MDQLYSASRELSKIHFRSDISGWNEKAEELIADVLAAPRPAPATPGYGAQARTRDELEDLEKNDPLRSVIMSTAQQTRRNCAFADAGGFDHAKVFSRLSLDARRSVMLKALKDSAGLVGGDDFRKAQARLLCPELSISQLRDGSALFDLVRHFSLDPETASFEYLRHPALEQRPLEEGDLLLPHELLVVFAWECLNVLDGTLRTNITELKSLVKPLPPGPDAFNRSVSSGIRCTVCLTGGWQLPPGEKMQRCGRCDQRGRLVSYCSKTCQKKDWKSHNAICGTPLTASSVPALPVDSPLRAHPGDTPLLAAILDEIRRDNVFWNFFDDAGRAYFVRVQGDAPIVVASVNARDRALATREPKDVAVFFAWLSTVHQQAEIGPRAGKLGDGALCEQLSKAFGLSRAELLDALPPLKKPKLLERPSRMMLSLVAGLGGGYHHDSAGNFVLSASPALARQCRALLATRNNAGSFTPYYLFDPSTPSAAPIPFFIPSNSMETTFLGITIYRGFATSFVIDRDPNDLFKWALKKLAKEALKRPTPWLAKLGAEAGEISEEKRG